MQCQTQVKTVKRCDAERDVIEAAIAWVDGCKGGVVEYIMAERSQALMNAVLALESWQDD